jgi:hypothetical protein
MPYDSLDASENLPKEDRCQMTFSQLKPEAARMSNQPAAGLEESLLEGREGDQLWMVLGRATRRNRLPRL